MELFWNIKNNIEIYLNKIGSNIGRKTFWFISSCKFTFDDSLNYFRDCTHVFMFGKENYKKIKVI